MAKLKFKDENGNFIPVVQDVTVNGISVFNGEVAALVSPISINSPTDGQTLIYNSTTQKFENQDIPSDAFICTFTQTTDPQTEEPIISCDKTIAEIIAASNANKTVLGKVLESTEGSETIAFIPLNLIYNDIVIFGGLTATPFGNTITLMYGVHNSSTDTDVWNVESNVLARVTTSGSYSDLSNKPTLGTAAALDVAESGNASSTQVVKGDDTRLAAEVLWCSWDDINNTVIGLTVQQIFDAKANHKVVCCKDDNMIFICTHASSHIVFSCVNSTVSASSDTTYLGYMRNDYIVYSPYSQKWAKDYRIIQRELIGSGTGQNIKTVNDNNLLGSGDVHISGDIMFLTATAGSNNTYKLSKTPQELINLYGNGITVIVDVAGYLFYRGCNSAPDFFNIKSNNTLRRFYYLANDEDGVNTIWRVGTYNIQEQLVSGTSIKTINNESILGSGDIIITASGINAIPSSEKGANGGVAELDSNGKVPSSQLPSYVDDVLEYASQSAFPVTGESGKIYIAQDTNKTYRWSGSAYVEISESIALGETSSTAYRGDRGKTAYGHSQITNGSNPHNTTLSSLTDTTISSPSDGQVLTYDNTTSKWINSAAHSGLPSQSGNSGKFLTTDGTDSSWANLPSDVVYCTWNGSTCSMTPEQIYEAYLDGKLVICKASINDTYSSTVLCTMTRIYLFNESSPGMGDDGGFVEFIGKYTKPTIDDEEDNIYRITAIKNEALGYTSWTWVGGDYINLENLRYAILIRHSHSNKTYLDKIPSSVGTNGQVLTSNGTSWSWQTPSGGGGLTNYDFTHTSNTTVTTSTTVTFAANTRGSQMVSTAADLSVTFAVNNSSDNYLWIKNTGSSDIDILISSVTYNSSSVSNVYLPNDGISVPSGKVCEIGIVCNADGAFITARSDLSL